MGRTKLEMYIGILKTLAQNGSLQTSNVAYEAKISYNELKKYLSFLLTQGLVDEQKVDKRRMVYSITRRGITVLKYLKELKQVAPITNQTRPSLSDKVARQSK